MPLEFALIIAGLVVVMTLGMGVVIAISYRKVAPGQALVVNKVKTAMVSFTGATVLPLHRAEVMDVTLKALTMTFAGSDGLVCRDNIRADATVTFYVRVSGTQEDVLKVAMSVGCARAGDPATLEELFFGKFSAAVRTVFKQLDFAEVTPRLEELQDRLIAVIGMDLSGYVLEDVAIGQVAQTALDQLDRDNVMDAEGIRRITEKTAREATETARIEAEQRIALATLAKETKARELELRTQIAVLEDEIAKLALGTRGS